MMVVVMVVEGVKIEYYQSNLWSGQLFTYGQDFMQQIK